MASRRKARPAPVPAPTPAAPTSAGPSRQSLAVILIIAALVVLEVAVYAPIGHQPFSLLDDPLYVSFNTNVSNGLTWSSVKWAWTTFYAANWHPITWLSHLGDAALFGHDAGPQHVVSLVFHVANTVLLFLGLRRLTGATGASGLVAALFGVHPLNVESVAWLAERKNVLSTFFWWTTMWAYIRYVHRPGRGRYAVVLVMLALGLMAKPMLVTVPIVLLLMDVWPLQRARWPWQPASETSGSTVRWPALVLEKLPLAALAIGSSIVTFIAQRAGGAVVELGTISLGQRLANAPVSYLRYLENAFWPAHLSVFYPYPRGIEWTAFWIAAAVLAGVTAVAIQQAGRRPYLLAGWLWYVVTLVPVIGVVQVGRQAMADRYAYVSLVGIFVAVVWTLRSIGTPRVPAIARTVAAIGVVLMLAFAARVQAGYWDSTESLLRHALDVLPTNGTALRGLAGMLSRDGRHDEAIAMYQRAIAARPDDTDSQKDLANEYSLRGVELADEGRFADAVLEFQDAVHLSPASASIRVKLGLALLGNQKPAEALTELQAAVAADPSDAEARYRSAAAYLQLRRFADAESAYRDAVRLNPKLAEAHSDLGRLLLALRRPDEAAPEFAAATTLQPDLESARVGLGLALAAGGHLPEARQALEAVLRIDPANDAARQALAEVVRHMK